MNGSQACYSKISLVPRSNKYNLWNEIKRGIIFFVQKSVSLTFSQTLQEHFHYFSTNSMSYYGQKKYISISISLDQFHSLNESRRNLPFYVHNGNASPHRIIYRIFCATSFSVVYSNYSCRMIYHPFISMLEAGMMIACRNIFHTVCYR